MTGKKGDPSTVAGQFPSALGGGARWDEWMTINFPTRSVSSGGSETFSEYTLNIVDEFGPEMVEEMVEYENVPIKMHGAVISSSSSPDVTLQIGIFDDEGSPVGIEDYQPGISTIELEAGATATIGSRYTLEPEYVNDSGNPVDFMTGSVAIGFDLSDPEEYEPGSGGTVE